MGQIIKTITGITVMPNPIRQYKSITGTKWSGVQLSNGYSKFSCADSNGAAIADLVIGYGRDNLDYNNPYYNNPANFGGQTTPVTPYLSPASDDSWAPRYQVSGQYQETTQVPTQQSPFMTHVYSYGASSGNIGIWRIAYVIDDNNFVVYDPTQTAWNDFDTDLVPICQNTFSATNIKIVADSLASVDFTYIQNSVSGIAGPFEFEFGPNQEGIVEPFLVSCSIGNCSAVITF